MRTKKGEKAVSDLPPLCMVQLGSQYDPNDIDLEKIRKDLKEEWAKIWDGKPPCPIFVLPPGMQNCFYG